MDERDLQAEEPCPGLLVDEIGAGPRELDQRRAEIAHLVRNVVHTGPALRQEPADRRVLVERREQLHPARADAEWGRPYAPLLDGCAVLDRCAEQALVRREASI